jgi:hypothetical protein
VAENDIWLVNAAKDALVAKPMPRYADSHPQFYNSYKNARIIIDLGDRGGGGDAPADGK